MPDREKVIKGLEIQLDDLQKYADATELLTLTQEHAKEILALLKEQEAVEPKEATDPNESHWNCGACGYPLWEDENYCAHCGKRVLWEGR